MPQPNDPFSDSLIERVDRLIARIRDGELIEPEDLDGLPDSERTLVLELLAGAGELQGRPLSLENNTKIPDGFDSTPLTAGAKIGPFRLLGLLGRGAMGTVYDAVHETTGERRAVKILSFLHAGPQALERFRREIDAAAALDHPCVVKVYPPEGDAAIDRYYYSMERVDGCTLDELYSRLESTPPRERTLDLVFTELGVREDPPRKDGSYVAWACETIADVADGLEHAHCQGIVHRDVKPSNIIVDRNAHPRILDFGLAKLLASEAPDREKLTLTGQTVGTLPYMSPEQHLGGKVPLDARSDVFSLGVTLYEALTGRRPNDGQTPHEIIQQTIAKDPPPPSRIHDGIVRDLDTIVLKCLEKDPDRRYQSAPALADDLRRFVSLRPIQARPPSTATKAWRAVRRHPMLSVLVGTLLISLTAVVPLGLQVARDRQRQEAQAIRINQNALIENAVVQAYDSEESGIVDCRLAIELDRANPIPRLLHASLALELGDQAARRRALHDNAPKQLIPDFPNHPGAYLLAAQVADSPAERDDLVRKGLQRRPFCWMDHLLLGRHYRDEGDLTAAERILSEGTILDPNARIYVGLELSSLLMKQKRFSEAISIRAVIEQRAPNWAVWPRYLLGSAFQGTGDFPSAVRMYEKALKIDSQHEASLRRLAEALTQIPGVEDAASEAYQRLFEVVDDANDWNNYGNFLVRRPNDIEGGIQAFRKALELDLDQA